MNALILAAGTATRLRPLTNNLPKCMLRIGKYSIIERTISNLIYYGIREIQIVTGYHAEKLQSFLTQKFPAVNITYIHNPIYDSTNNIYSLWLAREHVSRENLLLLDSDIIFDRRIIELLIKDAHENCLALRSQGHIGSEDMKIKTDSDNKILEISKQIKPDLAAGESVGIEKFSQEFVGQLFNILEDLIQNKKMVNKFYELAFQQAIEGGQALFARDIENLKCIEIDTPDDMQSAQNLVKDLI